MAGQIINLSTACADFTGLITLESFAGFNEGVSVEVTLTGAAFYSVTLLAEDLPYSFGHVQNGSYTIEVRVDGSPANPTFSFDGGLPTADSAFTVDCAGPDPEPTPTCSLRITEVSLEARTATVTVSGAAGPTEYSLDAFQTRQDGNVFADLEPNTYFLYARDKEHPLCVATAMLKVYATYAPRYAFAFTNMDGVEVEVEIHERDYTGEPEVLPCMGGTPVTISLNGTDTGKFHPLKPTECALELLPGDTFDFFGLYTADDRQYKVVVRYAGETAWQGFLIPNIYEQPYLPGPLTVKVKATDGLMDLSQVDFKPFSAPEMPFRLSIFEALLFCLYQLDLELPILTGVNTFAVGMDGTDPLTQAYVYHSFAVDGGDPITCLEALTAILTTFQAKIRQSGGGWKIYEENRLEGFPVRHYTHRGVPAGAGLASHLTPVRGPREGYPHFILNSQHLQVSPALKTLTMHFDYGGFLNYIPHGDFPQAITQPDGLPLGWERVGEEIGTTDPYGALDGLVFWGSFSEATGGEPSYLRSPGYFLARNAGVEGVRLSFSYYAYKDGVAERESADSDYALLYYSLKVGPYFATLSTGLKWTTIPTLIKYGTAQLNAKVDYAHYFTPPPVDGFVEVRFYEPFSTGPSGTTLDLVRIKDLAVNAGSLSVGRPPFQEEDYTGTNPGLIKLKGEKMDIRLGDTRPGFYARGIYFNGSNTTEWTNAKGLSGMLQQLTLKSMLDEVKYPTLILNCDLRGYVGFDAVLEDASLPGKRFITNAVSWDLRGNRWSGQYLEMGTVQPGAGSELNDFDMADFEAADFF